MNETIYTVNIGNRLIRLIQLSTERFCVEYGNAPSRVMDYISAAHEFGECVFHALAANGELIHGY